MYYVCIEIGANYSVSTTGYCLSDEVHRDDDNLNIIHPYSHSTNTAVRNIF